ncbi:hypothetical protein N7541_002796 [Penicillium brevicompactum]|uniref:Uncharacterized protein n=1 Tax=Penicillium brevicompactum TaxID=5074 RepID=A0A9W9RKR0_PENBR|nr:hypothetical protein N7541_002796 [Penicillium brevicompactum]
MIEVSASARNTLSKFDDILLLLALSNHESEVPIQNWEDERGRYRIWSANTGANHSGALSLDYRLKDVPAIKAQTVRILQRLQGLFETLEEAVDEYGKEPTKEEVLSMLGDQVDEDQTISNLWFNESELSHIFKTVVETITQLYQISIVITPLPDRDRLMETDNLNSVLQELQGGNGESQDEVGNQGKPTVYESYAK